MIPEAMKVSLDQEKKQITGLNFGLVPKLLPKCPIFDYGATTFTGTEGHGSNVPSFFREQFYLVSKELNNPTKLKEILIRFECFKCKVFYDPNVGQNPGLMESHNYSYWSTCDESEKKKFVAVLAEWIVELYTFEMNYLVQKKLEKRKRNMEARHVQSAPLKSIAEIHKFCLDYPLNVQGVVTLDERLPNVTDFGKYDIN